MIIGGRRCRGKGKEVRCDTNKRKEGGMRGGQKRIGKEKIPLVDICKTGKDMRGIQEIKGKEVKHERKTGKEVRGRKGSEI